jgi:hypothetical protein
LSSTLEAFDLNTNDARCINPTISPSFADARHVDVPRRAPRLPGA